MIHCELCGNQAEIRILDDFRKERHLCEWCYQRFDLCECCMEFELAEDLSENGLCDSCNEQD